MVDENRNLTVQTHYDIPNPKKEAGSKKVPFSYLPMAVMAEVSVGMYEGCKYGGFNYRCVGGIDAMDYTDAAMRHITDYIEGRDIDIHSPAKLHNITKAITSLVVLRDSMLAGTYNDNRPPRIKETNWLDRMSGQVVEITERTPNAIPRYTEVTRPDRAVDEVLIHGGQRYIKQPNGHYWREEDVK